MAMIKPHTQLCKRGSDNKLMAGNLSSLFPIQNTIIIILRKQKEGKMHTC